MFLGAVLSNALASILLKIFSNKGGEVVNIMNPTTLLYVGSSAFLYFLAFIFYAMLLKTVPLSKAYIFMTSGVQLCLLLAGFVFFKEKITISLIAGIFFIFLGLFFLTVKGMD